MKPRFQFDDGGRAAAGFKGATGDCFCRAAAIASGRPYAEIYALVNEEARRERGRKRRGKVQRSSAREGVYGPTARKVLAALGGTWYPTMAIGAGCKVHLRAKELPAGRLVCAVSRHFVAVIDGVIHDLDDPSRDGTRCVYGYWEFVPGGDELLRRICPTPKWSCLGWTGRSRGAGSTWTRSRPYKVRAGNPRPPPASGPNRRAPRPPSPYPPRSPRRRTDSPLRG